jgi:copper/silver efflux system protein
VKQYQIEVGGPMVTAVSNTIISFIPVFALTGPEGKMFKPLAYTKTFAITASIILALTLVPVLCYYLLKPIKWSRRRSLLAACLVGIPVVFITHFFLGWGFGTSGRWSGWPTAIGVGIMVAAR